MAWTNVFSDAFADTNGTALATHDSNWVEYDGGAEIQSNQAVPSNLTAYAILEGANLSNDQAAEITIHGSPSGSEGVGVRMTSVGAGVLDFEGYYVTANWGFGWIVPWRQGDANNVATLDPGVFIAASLSPGDTLRIEVEGDQITVKHNGDVVGGPYTDANYSSGDVGIVFNSAFGAGGTLDNFSCDHVPAVIPTKHINLISLYNSRLDLVSLHNSYPELRSLHNHRVDILSNYENPDE